MLTPREAQVMDLVCRSTPYKQIGFILHITPKTVQATMTGIFNKLGMRTKVRVAIWWTLKSDNPPDSE